MQRTGPRAGSRYLRDLIEALEETRRIAGVKEINALGYCLGGTLLAATLDVLRRQRTFFMLTLALGAASLIELPYLPVGSPANIAVAGLSQIYIRDLLKPTCRVEARRQFVGERLMVDEAVVAGGAEAPLAPLCFAAATAIRRQRCRRRLSSRRFQTTTRPSLPVEVALESAPDPALGGFALVVGAGRVRGGEWEDGARAGAIAGVAPWSTTSGL